MYCACLVRATRERAAMPRRLRRLRALPRLAWTLLLAAAPLHEASAQAAASPSDWHEGLRALRPDPARGATVAGLTLVRDAGTFHLDSGQIHLLLPVAGRTVGAVFVGEGRFEMAAPDEVEQGQLLRHFRVAAVAQPLRAAVLLFTDSTVAELERRLTLGALAPSSDAQREIDEALDYFTDDDDWVAREMLVPLINASPDWFYAHFSQDRDDPMIFSVDPHQFEETSISKRSETGKAREMVAQFHRAADYATGQSIPQEALDLLTISSVEIETRLDDDLEVVGRSTAHLLRRMVSYRWIPFRLYSGLEVDSLRWGNGAPARFERPDDSPDLWVDFSDAPIGDVELTFHYSGELMERPSGLWVVLRDNLAWFPIHEFNRLIPYRMTFRVPEEFVVNTLGRRLSEETADGFTTSTWETDPVDLLTFNLGQFESYESREPGAPDLTVFLDEGAHRRLEGMVASGNRFLLRQNGMAEAVALDLRNAFRFMNEVYGPTTVESFVATEIFSNHGEAYPGLVLLAWSTFQMTDAERGYDEMFRAHEVAHQWWGISVEPATYRDRWLAEGFSEFSGWWYAARARASLPIYLKRLEETREEILARRDQAPPIALGTRVMSSRYPGDYQTTIYHKGAWVLHMLRMMLTDAETGSDQAFTDVMKIFYTRHRDGKASTRSFQQVAEEVVGVDFDWFFDQWVYRSAIPTYTFSSTLIDQPDGTVKAVVRIRQEDVPEDFKMIVPIELDFGEAGAATVQVLVEGPLTEAELPPLPMRPRAVTFNPYEAVLAETRTEDWRN
jgi:hypothetical protein